MTDAIGIVLLVVAMIGLRLWASWVRRNRNRSRFMWVQERLRSAMAYEGDPGPYKEQS